MGNLKPWGVGLCIPNDLKQCYFIMFCANVNDSGFLSVAEIQVNSVPDLPVSTACFLCMHCLSRQMNGSLWLREEARDKYRYS